MSPHLAPLAERAVIAVTGAEAAAFLHGLVTADVLKLEPGQAAYGALLTPQGKVLFDFFLVRQPDGFLIDCSSAQAGALAARLGMYTLRRPVEVARREDLGVAVAWGGDAPAIEGAIVYPDPRLAAAGFRLIAPLKSLSGTATAADYAAHRVGHGLADSDADIGSGEMFPHEANLDRLGGVSFSKGCFVGQEVVSRMQHRGTARARIVPVTGNGLTAGSDIRAGDRVIGKVLSVAGGKGLAFIRLDRAAKAAEAGETPTAGGQPIEIQAPARAARETVPGEQ